MTPFRNARDRPLVDVFRKRNRRAVTTWEVVNRSCNNIDNRQPNELSSPLSPDFTSQRRCLYSTTRLEASSRSLLGVVSPSRVPASIVRLFSEWGKICSRREGKKKKMIEKGARNRGQAERPFLSIIVRIRVSTLRVPTRIDTKRDAHAVYSPRSLFRGLDTAMISSSSDRFRCCIVLPIITLWKLFIFIDFIIKLVSV